MALRTMTTLDVPSAVAAGDSMPISSASAVTVFVSGTFVATYQVETSHDGTVWKAETPASAPAVVQVTSVAAFIRVNVTAYTSGTIVATAGLQG